MVEGGSGVYNYTWGVHIQENGGSGREAKLEHVPLCVKLNTSVKNIFLGMWFMEELRQKKLWGQGRGGIGVFSGYFKPC